MLGEAPRCSSAFRPPRLDGEMSGSDSLPETIDSKAAPGLFAVILAVLLAATPAFAQHPLTRVSGSGLELAGDKDGGLTWFDFDNDGCLDVLINTADESTVFSRLFWQIESAGSCTGVFEDLTDCLASGLLGALMDPARVISLERSAVAGDLNNDGFIDFARTTAGNGSSSRRHTSEAYLNNGPGTNSCGDPPYNHINFPDWLPFGTTSTDPGDLPNITHKGSPADPPLGDIQDQRIDDVTSGYDINAELMAWMDVDADGWLDLVIDTHDDGIYVARNNGDFSFDSPPGGGDATPFEEITPGLPVGAGVGGSGSDGDYGAVVDVDGDGDVDLLDRKSPIGTGGDPTFANDFYLNDGVGPEYFPNNAFHRRDVGDASNSNKGGVAVCDFDNDRDFDVVWLEGSDGNKLWRNDDVATLGLTALTQVSFYEDGVVFSFPTDVKNDGVVCADFNNDTFLDLYITADGDDGGSDPDDPQGDWLFLHLGTFVTESGGDVPNFTCASGPSTLCTNNTDTEGTGVCDTGVDPLDIGCGDGEGVAAADYDRDGDADLLINQNGPTGSLGSITTELWENTTCDPTCPASGDYVVIRALEADIPVSSSGSPATGERDAIGATIRLFTCTNPLATVSGIREVNGGRGHGAQDPAYVHFGLGTPLPDDPSFDEYIAQVRFVGGDIAQTCFSLSDFPGYHLLEIRDTDPIEEAQACCAPDAALITSFRGYEQGGHLVLEWETGFEAGTAGFEVYRIAAGGLDPVRVSDGLLAVHTPAPKGSTYRWVDRSAAPPFEDYEYILVEREVWGKQRLYGPYKPVLHGTRRPMEAPAGSTFHRAPKPLDLLPGPSARPARLLPAESQVDNIRAHLTETGFYRVTASEIASVTGQPVQVVRQVIQNGQILVRHQGEEVARVTQRQGKAVYFFGEAIDSIYTNENVYRLELGSAGTTVTAAAAPAPPTGPSTFLDSLDVQDNLFSAALIGADPEEDMWYWDVLVNNEKSFDFDPPDPDVDGSGGTLNVRLHGALAQPHRVQVWLNSTLLGEATWSGVSPHAQTFTVSPGTLLSGTNTIRLKDVAPSIVYVDGFDVGYQRFFVADDDALLFRPDGNSPITISGFTRREILLLNITDPGHPVEIEATIDRVDKIDRVGPYRLSFEPTSPTDRYLAFSLNALRAVDRLAGDEFGDLRNTANRADWVLITSEEMEAPAQELVDLRNLAVEAKLVFLQDIYDEFNDGIADPNAIREFLEYASGSWAVGPGVAVAGGKGHHDYKDHLGIGGNVVPPLLVRTVGGTYAADLRYVGFGEAAPSIAVGRIPARNEAQFRAFVDKLKAYEGSGGTWTDAVTLLADDPDEAGDFHGTSDDLAEIIPSSFSAQKIYLPVGATQTEIEATRQALFDALEAGTVLLNYVGHGAPDRLAGEALLHQDDVPGLTNAPRLPILTAMTCIIARFGHPQVVSLAEDLVLHGAGGAAGVMAPTGLSTNFDSGRLDELLFEELFSGSHVSFAQVWLAALGRYADLYGELEPIMVYNYLGDPWSPLK